MGSKTNMSECTIMFKHFLMFRLVILLMGVVAVSHLSESKAMFGPTSTLSSQSTVEIDSMIGVEGHPVELPCDLTPPNPNEQVYLVLWYRQDEGGEPIYSYDARSGGPENGRRWSDEERGFGDRAHFQLHRHPSMLHIEQIKAREAGIYRCRVDFKTAPTRNSLLNLTVIIPPNKPTIFDESGREVKDLIGPYLEGDTIVLKCIVSGGDPSPELTWWRDSHLIDTSYETTYSGTVQNSLSVPQVNREDLGATLTCQASNNNISTPTSSKVTIDLKFRPESVNILNKKEPVSAGREYNLDCKSIGSRPPATVTWWKNVKFLQQSTTKFLDHGNVTISSLSFKPRPTDHGKTITCRSENTELTNSALEDHWKLIVYYAPTVALSLGANLDPEAIAEGNDVYFECAISANPEVYKVVWLHNDVMVQHEKTSGVIISGSSLVLQSVTRKQAGIYACVASNIEGDTQSNVIELKVMFKPLCENFGRIVQGVGRGQPSEVICPIIAHPPPTAFHWTFNNSQETIQITSDKYSSNQTHSRLKYQPEDDGDFGLISCWATNFMGAMEMPCTFQLIPAGPPEAPTNCSVVNQTTDSLDVQCLSGFDGGLEQHFILEVADLQTGILLANASDKLPEFRVSGLNSGRGLKITIYAINSNGVSKSAILEGFTLKVAELQLESPVPLQFTPVLGILVGVVVTLMLVAFVILLVLRFKYKSSKAANSASRNSQVGHSSSSKRGSRNRKPTSIDDKNLKSSSPIGKPGKHSFDEDEEEYFCLRGDDNQTNFQPRQDEADHNPDIITDAFLSDTQSRLLMRSATPVKSDASGSTVSGYGTGDSGGSCGSAPGSACDKTPPYLPRNHFNNSATLGRANHPKSEVQRQPLSYMDNVTYAQLTLPSPRHFARPHNSNFGPFPSHSPSPDTVIYSQLDPHLTMTSSGGRFHPNQGNNCRIIMNPQEKMSPSKGNPYQGKTSRPRQDDESGSWAPLLSSKQQESTL